MSRFLDMQAGAGALLDQGVYALTWADIALSHGSSDATTRVIHASSKPVQVGEINVDKFNTIILSKTGGQPGHQSAFAIVTTSMTGPDANSLRSTSDRRPRNKHPASKQKAQKRRSLPPSHRSGAKSSMSNGSVGM